MVKILKIACQKVLKQYCHKIVLRIKHKQIKWTLLDLSAQKKMTNVIYFLKVSFGKKRLQLKKMYLTR